MDLEALQRFLEPAVGQVPRNQYHRDVNSPGIALPPEPVPMR